MWLAGVVLLCSLAVGVLSTASEEVSCASGDGAPCLDWDLGECATTIDTELQECSFAQSLPDNSQLDTSNCQASSCSQSGTGLPPVDYLVDSLTVTALPLNPVQYRLNIQWTMDSLPPELTGFHVKISKDELDSPGTFSVPQLCSCLSAESRNYTGYIDAFQINKERQVQVEVSTLPGSNDKKQVFCDLPQDCYQLSDDPSEPSPQPRCYQPSGTVLEECGLPRYEEPKDLEVVFYPLGGNSSEEEAMAVLSWSGPSVNPVYAGHPLVYGVEMLSDKPGSSGYFRTNATNAVLKPFHIQYRYKFTVRVFAPCSGLGHSVHDRGPCGAKAQTDILSVTFQPSPSPQTPHSSPPPTPLPPPTSTMALATPTIRMEATPTNVSETPQAPIPALNTGVIAGIIASALVLVMVIVGVVIMVFAVQWSRGDGGGASTSALLQLDIVAPRLAPPPTVLLVYSLASPEGEREAVLQHLVRGLGECGLDVVSQEWAGRETPAYWLERSLVQAAAVLCVCNEAFCREWNGDTNGSGVQSNIVYPLKQLLASDIAQGQDISKYFVVLLKHKHSCFIPTEYFKSRKMFLITETQSIARAVTNTPEFEKDLDH